MSDIAERLKAVETRLETMEKTQNDMAGDLRMVRDYMIERAGVTKALKRVLSIVIGILTVGGALWKISKGLPPDLGG